MTGNPAAHSNLHDCGFQLLQKGQYREPKTCAELTLMLSAPLVSRAPWITRPPGPITAPIFSTATCIPSKAATMLPRHGSQFWQTQ
jgi:hypothetical protein